MNEETLSLYPVRIIRLKTGLELIAQKHIVDTNGNIYYKDIMRFGMAQSDNGMAFLQLAHWCPLSIYSDRMLPINYADILFEATPSKALLKYYVDTVNKLEESIQKYPDGFSKIMTWTDILKELEDGVPEGDKPVKPSDLN